MHALYGKWQAFHAGDAQTNARAAIMLSLPQQTVATLCTLAAKSLDFKNCF
jgi:hypothetical protein